MTFSKNIYPELTIDEIIKYRKEKAAQKKSAGRVKRRKKTVRPPQTELELDESMRTELWLDYFVQALKDDKSTGDEYRLWQGKASEKSKRRKSFKWMKVNETKGFLPRFYTDRDNWLSAATYYSRWKSKKFVASINCNFIIIKWEKSELDYTPTPEQGKELVLSVCREIGLPEPRITYTPGGLEVKWYWRDRMQKVFYAGDIFCSKFNEDWEKMQRELYKKFWYLGVDLRKGATVMFSMPGSVCTTKKFKTDDRLVRDIHEGVTVDSYREIQKILGLDAANKNESPENYSAAEWEAFRQQNSELSEDWLADVLKLHPPGQNWVCIGMMINDKWSNHWEMAFNLPQYLMKLSKHPDFASRDIYVSQGEFLSRYSRRVKNLASIRAAFVDLDYKILVQYRPDITQNPSPQEWEKLVTEYCAENKIPLPNDFVFTGGGVHLKWIFEEAVANSGLESWQNVQQMLHVNFVELGADPATTDAARVLRLAGTKNHKDNPIVTNRNVFLVNRQYFSQIKITLNGLMKELEKLPPKNDGEITPEPERKKERKKHSVDTLPEIPAEIPDEDKELAEINIPITVTLPNSDKCGNFRKVAAMRFEDILRWLEFQRKSSGEIPQKVRELCVFWALVSARQAGIVRTYKEFCELAQKLINLCGSQFASECTIDTVKSAFTKNYHVKTITLIKTLRISPEAQKRMKVLSTEKLSASRRFKQTRAEYLESHSQERTKPWESLGISRRTYFRRKKAGTLPQFEEAV